MDQIFLSSSFDLADLRANIGKQLRAWLERNGFADMVQPFLWEDENEDGLLFSARLQVQRQLPDPASPNVPLTICMFGERCGIPLEDSFGGLWLERFRPWLATEDGPGLRHPWPRDDRQASQRALDRGQFPLTGTVFELLSANLRGEDADNLIIGYVASRPVDDGTAVRDINFNDRRLWKRLVEGKTQADEDIIRSELYTPQVQALLNVIKFIGREFRFPDYYQSVKEMERGILAQAERKLRKHLGIASLRNPFKSSLIHWSIDDREELPGRGALSRKICEKLLSRSDAFVLLKGRSGCGKSSIMQRGVLSRLREEQGALVLAFRPTDLGEDMGRTDRLERLWRIITEVVNLPGGIDSDGIRALRATNYAKQLCQILGDRSSHLIIGVDQFEEIIDELKFCEDRGETVSGWTPVLTFLSALSASPNVWLIGTLESSRESTFLELGLEARMGLQRNIMSVEIGADEIAEIARDGFARGGLPLDAPVLEEIKTRWTQFEKTADVSHASPLPLACLFLSRLYERFEHIAGATAGDRLHNAFGRAEEGESDRLLTLEDIGGPDGIAFENIIQDLADQAWRAAGVKTDFVTPIEKDPHFNRVVNFLGPLATIDLDGCVQLRSIREQDADDTTRRLRKEFVKRRLLVPARGPALGGEKESPRLRLVHQSVIDRWSLARQWKDYISPRLQIERKFRERAKYCLKFAETMPVDEETIDAAAVTLSENTFRWRMQRAGSSAPEDAGVLEQALKVFSHARVPRAISGPRNKSTYAHLAATYHLIDLLEKFHASDPTILEECTADGRNLLEAASWSEGPAVEWLLKRGAKLKSPSFDWNVICAPLQMQLHDQYDLMVQYLENVDVPVGPHGLRLVHMAAQYGNRHVLDHLRTNQAAMDARDQYRRTALHFAAMRNQAATFEYLLPFLSPLTEDLWGYTPVDTAVASGSLDALQAFLRCSPDGDTLTEALTHRNKAGETPLMIAVRSRRPEIVRRLLRWDLADLVDPSSPDERTSEGGTLFHLAFSMQESNEPSDEDRFLAREVVRILLEDGRLDPTLKDNEGRTPFDVATNFEEARSLIRQDERVLNDYDSLTTEMRREDLANRRLSSVLRFVREAPQSLTHKHGDETGLQILIRLKNVAALAAIIEDGITPMSLLSDHMKGLAEVAQSAAAEPLREVLVQRVATRDIDPANAAPLLNAAIVAKDWDAVTTLQDAGVPVEPSRLSMGLTFFHHAAIHGDIELFERIASIQKIALPLDDWGRRPSDIAPDTMHQAFRVFEDDLFEAPHPPAKPPNPTKFHKLAREGSVDEFECQARGVTMTVPLDQDGLRPSEVAPEDKRDEFRAIEDRYFSEVH